MARGEAGTGAEVAAGKDESQDGKRGFCSESKDAHDEGEEVDWAPTEDVADGAEERGRDALDDHVDDDRDVDLLDAHAEVARDGRDDGEVDVC